MDKRLVRLRQQLLPNGVQALAWIVTTGTVIIYANSALPSLKRARAVREAMRAANVRGRYHLLIWPAVLLYSFTGKGAHGKTGADRLMADIRTGAAHVSKRGIIAGIAGAGILTGILAVAVATGSPGSNPARPTPRRAVPAASPKASPSESSPGFPGSSRSTARSSPAASQIHANSSPQGSAANDAVNAQRLSQGLTSTPAARTPITRTTAAPRTASASARPVSSPPPSPSLSASPTPAPSRTCSIADLHLRHVNVCVFH